MKAVLFDLDNTLLIKRPTIPEKWLEVIADRGYAVSEEAVQRAFAACEFWVGEQTRLENSSGIRLSDEEFLSGVINCCLKVLHLPEAEKAALQRVWMGDYTKTYEISCGAVQTLDELAARGVLLGIVSNNRAEIRAILDSLCIRNFFQTIIISDEVGLCKPDPRILAYACEKLGVKPDEAVYVGDHPFDVVCAHEACMPAAWIPINRYMKLPEDISEPEYRLESLADLLTLF